MSHQKCTIRFRRELTPESIRDEFYLHDQTRKTCRPDDCGGIFIEEAVGRIRLVPNTRFLWTLHILNRPSYNMLHFLDLQGARFEVSPTVWRRVSRCLKKYFEKPDVNINDGQILPCVVGLSPAQQIAIITLDEMTECTSHWIHFSHIPEIPLVTLRALGTKGLLELDEVKLRAKIIIN